MYDHNIIYLFLLALNDCDTAFAAIIVWFWEYYCLRSVVRSMHTNDNWHMTIFSHTAEEITLWTNIEGNIIQGVPRGFTHYILTLYYVLIWTFFMYTLKHAINLTAYLWK